MANPFTVQPLGGLQNVANIQQGMQGIAQNAQQDRAEEQQAKVKERFAKAMQSGNNQELAQLSMQYPEVGEAAMSGIKFANESTKANLRDSMQRIVAGEDPEQVIAERAQMVQEQGGDPSDTLRELERVQQDPEGYRQQVENVFAMSHPEEYSAYKSATGQDSSSVPAGTREFQALVEASKSDDPLVSQAAKIKLRLEPGAGTLSSDQRAALDDFLGEKVVDYQRRKTSAGEEGKLETQKEMLPGIRSSIKLAEQQAKDRGEALGDYERAKAALPGLQEVVNKLTTLSDVATYTMGGKALNAISRELGLGSTEGGTARAQMESIVNNQILPILKETFGGIVSDSERESLRTTLIDMDAAPAQKKAILQSFMDQKMRELEEKRGRASTAGQPEASSQEDEEEDIDALLNKYLEQ